MIDADNESLMSASRQEALCCASLLMPLLPLAVGQRRWCVPMVDKRLAQQGAALVAKRRRSESSGTRDALRCCRRSKLSTRHCCHCCMTVAVNSSTDTQLMVSDSVESRHEATLWAFLEFNVCSANIQTDSEPLFLAPLHVVDSCAFASAFGHAVAAIAGDVACPEASPQVLAQSTPTSV